MYWENEAKFHGSSLAFEVFLFFTFFTGHLWRLSRKWLFWLPITFTTDSRWFRVSESWISGFSFWISFCGWFPVWSKEITLNFLFSSVSTDEPVSIWTDWGLSKLFLVCFQTFCHPYLVSSQTFHLIHANFKDLQKHLATPLKRV